MANVPAASSTIVCVPESETETGAVVAPALATARTAVSAARLAIQLSFLNMSSDLPIRTRPTVASREGCPPALENRWQTTGGGRSLLRRARGYGCGRPLTTLATAVRLLANPSIRRPLWASSRS